MLKTDILKTNIKKKRIKVKNIDDFIKVLNDEGYDKNKSYCIDKDDLDKSVLKYLNNDITYTAKNLSDLLEYFKEIDIFESSHKELCEKINHVKTLNIYRTEYDRKSCAQEDVDEILKVVEKIKDDISEKADECERFRINNIERELNKEYIYAKDIELLKKMVSFENKEIEENYNAEEKVKRVSVNIKDNISTRYIPVENGSIEYHDHLNNNIPRIQRLINNLHRYITEDEFDDSIYSINQSETLNDSINIAVAMYDNNEYKAISGSNEVLDYCASPHIKEARFESNKVNKLGKLGTGYNRVNDSEKKIFEKIHKEIEEKKVRDNGELILYSKWEPCPSCYYVIYQFCRIHPDIKVKVKYINRYGE
ncbi:MAG: deaminase domain-containing protein [Clostridium sp.]|nr:deaminase domain-containing protein [Clostridium sp.]